MFRGAGYRMWPPCGLLASEMGREKERERERGKEGREEFED